MAKGYDSSNEVRTNLASIRKNQRGDFVNVDKIEKNGKVSVDIRNWYTNDEDELMPTSKGIRVNSEMLLDVVQALVKCLEANEMMDVQDLIDELVDGKYEEASESEEMTEQED